MSASTIRTSVPKPLDLTKIGRLMRHEDLAVRSAPVILQLPPEQGSKVLRCFQFVIFHDEDHRFRRFSLVVGEAITPPSVEFLQRLAMVAVRDINLTIDEGLPFRWSVHVDPRVSALFEKNADQDALDEVGSQVCVQHLLTEGIIRSTSEVEATIN
jgi:hypothetical protein